LEPCRLEACTTNISDRRIQFRRESSAPLGQGGYAEIRNENSMTNDKMIQLVVWHGSKSRAKREGHDLEANGMDEI
jgi:hypothetical protein